MGRRRFEDVEDVAKSVLRDERWIRVVRRRYPLENMNLKNLHPGSNFRVSWRLAWDEMALFSHLILWALHLVSKGLLGGSASFSTNTSTWWGDKLLCSGRLDRHLFGILFDYTSGAFLGQSQFSVLCFFLACFISILLSLQRCLEESEAIHSLTTATITTATPRTHCRGNFHRRLSTDEYKSLDLPT
ncbi:hypothetical protein ACRALDRAFT_213335 [Sodiomyces alcalophilus JCM 7366]|uniref:uncharacterized protein n=1 Tax=Sodiomyces alcalophilus JCM 7366 TaxID=591952 RepID=UPI0039B3B1AC